MKIEKTQKKSFAVIGKEGSTEDGEGFIGRLWDDANSHFEEVKHLAKKDENGNIEGIWGAMSDFSRSFKPWEEDFSKGLYLAGVECEVDAKAPEGWTKWIIPGYEYIYVEVENDSTFSKMIQYLKEHNLHLTGAVHDFSCPQTAKNYMFFPIKSTELLDNLDKLHTTELGIERIKRNLSLDIDNVAWWCRDKISSPEAVIVRNGKNWYVEIDGCVITANAYSYTIITAHKNNVI